MNESTRTQLMILVERAVRPVQASTPRKRTMREELLTHVTAVFEEETAKLGDDSAALERAALRFGNPAELTSQLQETVPASDRFARFWEGQPDESPLRAATRLAMMALALALVIFFGLLFAGGARPVLQSEAILLCAPNLFALPLYLFSLAFLADWMRKALYGPAGRSWLKFALIAVGWWVLSLLMMVALPFLKGAWDADSDLWVAIVFASWVGNPLCPYALARSAADRLSYHQEWASLRIDG